MKKEVDCINIKVDQQHILSSNCPQPGYTIPVIGMTLSSGEDTVEMYEGANDDETRPGKMETNGQTQNEMDGNEFNEIYNTNRRQKTNGMSSDSGSDDSMFVVQEDGTKG